MATEKQVGLMMARAKDAGVTVNREDLVLLDDAGIDDKLDGFAFEFAMTEYQKANPTDKPTKEDIEAPEAPSCTQYADVSGNNFGMAAKAVINADYELHRKGFKAHGRADLIENIHFYYELLQEARAQLSSSSSEVAE